MRLFVRILIFLILTAATQVGGLGYLLGLLVVAPGSSPGRRLVFILIGYAFVSIAASILAPLNGRVGLPCWGATRAGLQLQSPLYCVLNRRYVTRDTWRVANGLAGYMSSRYPGAQTEVLDANFPFLDGFPMFPHLSHDDGKKLDFALFYQTPAGRYAPGVTRSPVGYWAFEEPLYGQESACPEEPPGFGLRWNMDWFQIFNRDLVLEPERTQAMLHWLVKEGRARGVEKVFVEPHLARRLGVEGGALRFQGCAAARHDDHIHIQLR